MFSFAKVQQNYVYDYTPDLTFESDTIKFEKGIVLRLERILYPYGILPETDRTLWL